MSAAGVRNGGAALFLQGDKLDPEALAAELAAIEALVNACKLATSELGSDTDCVVFNLCCMASERAAFLAQQLAEHPAQLFLAVPPALAGQGGAA